MAAAHLVVRRKARATATALPTPATGIGTGGLDGSAIGHRHRRPSPTTGRSPNKFTPYAGEKTNHGLAQTSASKLAGKDLQNGVRQSHLLHHRFDASASMGCCPRKKKKKKKTLLTRGAMNIRSLPLGVGPGGGCGRQEPRPQHGCQDDADQTRHGTCLCLLYPLMIACWAWAAWIPTGCLSETNAPYAPNCHYNLQGNLLLLPLSLVLAFC